MCLLKEGSRSELSRVAGHGEVPALVSGRWAVGFGRELGEGFWLEWGHECPLRVRKKHVVVRRKGQPEVYA